MLTSHNIVRFFLKRDEKVINLARFARIEALYEANTPFTNIKVN